jgi:hypothetical protein
MIGNYSFKMYLLLTLLLIIIVLLEYIYHTYKKKNYFLIYNLTILH